MNEIMPLKNSQCQTDLENDGYCVQDFHLSTKIKELVHTRNFDHLDQEFHKLTSKEGKLFKRLSLFESFNEIEFIISLREAKNEWEEDGIWHDDGSRKLAFSLSLTLDAIEGGILEFKKKGANDSFKIPTPAFGKMIIFKTGVDNYEHKINRVTKGSRLIIAGWCS